jgi:hypothetical protein
MIDLGDGMGRLGWTFVDATGKDSKEIARIETWVQARSKVVEGILLKAQVADSTSSTSHASTSSDLVKALFPSNSPTDSSTWSAAPYPSSDSLSSSDNSSFVSPFLNHHLSPSLLNAVVGMKPLPWTASTGMIACWYSHHQIIKQFAAEWTSLEVGVLDGNTARVLGGGKRENSLLILEDDVDMERDADEILDGLLGDGKLPEDWDILYLGASRLFFPLLPPPTRPPSVLIILLSPLYRLLRLQLRSNRQSRPFHLRIFQSHTLRQHHYPQQTCSLLDPSPVLRPALLACLRALPERSSEARYPACSRHVRVSGRIRRSFGVRFLAAPLPFPSLSSFLLPSVAC